jgi:hypothetical protein
MLLERCAITILLIISALRFSYASQVHLNLRFSAPPPGAEGEMRAGSSAVDEEKGDIAVQLDSTVDPDHEDKVQYSFVYDCLLRHHNIVYLGTQ